MGHLPIPADIFFKDFGFDLMEYRVERHQRFVGSFKGLLNKDEDGKHIAFLMDANVQTDDYLVGDVKTYVVERVDYDYYNGERSLLKAYY